MFVLKCMFVVNRHGILKREHGNQLARSSDETSFVVTYVNCVLKVSANELFPDQVDETKMALIYKLTVGCKFLHFVVKFNDFLSMNASEGAVLYQITFWGVRQIRNEFSCLTCLRAWLVG